MKSYNCQNCAHSHSTEHYYLNGLFVNCEVCGSLFQIDLQDIADQGIETSVADLHLLLDDHFIDMKKMFYDNQQIRLKKDWTDNQQLSYRFIQLPDEDSLAMPAVIKLMNESEDFQSKLYNYKMAKWR